MKRAQYDYNSNPKNKEADRKLLIRKSFRERVAILASIGPKYGVKIFPKFPDDPKCEDFYRLCPIHGQVPVKLNAMTVRGNFACHHCVNEIQGQICKEALAQTK